MKKVIVSILVIIMVVAVGIGGRYLWNSQQKGKNFIEKINKMDNSEIAYFFYNSEYSNGFDVFNVKNYRYSYASVNTLKEAVEEVETYGKNEEKIETKLVDETDYYFAVYNKYISYRDTGDVTFEDTYVVFKKNIFDVESKIINLDLIHTKEEVKKILDLYVFLSKCKNASIKIFEPTINEEKEYFKYSYYFFETVYGDYGLRDKISLNKETIKVDKKNGEISEDYEEIKSVQGKMN